MISVTRFHARRNANVECAGPREPPFSLKAEYGFAQ